MIRFITLLLVVVHGSSVLGQMADESPSAFARRSAWWREARFGMFIHWGLYSVAADATDRQGNHRIAEWYFSNKQMQVKDYEALAPRFDPVGFDAAEWVRLARDAGMEYLVITTKHHDGFALWDSRLTEWDIVDATPFKRDVLRELAVECQRQDVRLCFYHSIMDWHHPDYLPRREWERETRPADTADLNRYLDFMKGQLAELLTSYGPIGILWWDGGWELDGRRFWSPDIEARMRPKEINAFVRSLQPKILINDRNNLPADYSTPEQSVPAMAFPDDRLWETCMTMNRTWGYATNDTAWKSSTELIRKLCDIAHKGGNFLLNVGPTPEGVFPPESVERLADIGAWMRVNGDAIRGTARSPFRVAPFDGRCTVKGRDLYLHVFEWPAGELAVEGLQTRVRRARVLDGGQSLNVRFTRDRFGVITAHIQRPTRLDPHATVVALRLAGPPRTVDLSPAVRATREGVLHLLPGEAAINGTTGVIWLNHDPTRDVLTRWEKLTDHPAWLAVVPETGRYAVSVTYACPADAAGSEYRVEQAGGDRVHGTVQATEPGQWRTDQLGTLALERGRQTLAVHAALRPGPVIMELKEVTLSLEQ